MKHRILAALLTLTLMLGMIPATLAADAAAAKAAADTLNSMGMFSGTGTNADGTPNYDLDRSPTRQEAITMLVKLVGGADEAGKGGWKTPFTDVDDWAKNWVGYAYTKGLTSGTSATTFGANDKVTTAQYLTFLLKALGYDASKDFSWDKAWELTDRIGMTDGQYNAETTTFTRGDMAILSAAALKTPIKNEGRSLSGKLSGTAAETNIIYQDRNLKLYSTTAGLGMKNMTDKKVYLTIHNFTINGATFTSGTDLTLEAGATNTASLSFDMGAAVMSASVRASGGKVYHIETEPSFNVKKHPELDPAKYTGYVSSDFRSIKRDYSTATALYGYVYTYTDSNGDVCALSTVMYKIGTKTFTDYILHNISTGKRIENPTSYYDRLADNAYGKNKLAYMDLSIDAIGAQSASLRALASIIKDGVNTGRGAYVSASKMN